MLPEEFLSLRHVLPGQMVVTFSLKQLTGVFLVKRACKLSNSRKNIEQGAGTTGYLLRELVRNAFLVGKRREESSNNVYAKNCKKLGYATPGTKND